MCQQLRFYHDSWWCPWHCGVLDCLIFFFFHLLSKTQVVCVINFEPPEDEYHKADAVIFQHRVGRAGRFGRKGIVISIYHDKNTRELYQTIERGLVGGEMLRIPYPITDPEALKDELKLSK